MEITKLTSYHKCQLKNVCFLLEINIIHNNSQIKSEWLKYYLISFYNMVRLLYTIWALMLNSLKISIFQTCFANALEDEEGLPLISSPPITVFLIATSIYIIVVNSTIFPQSFRQPKPTFMCLYEVSVTIKILFRYLFSQC